MLAAIPSFVAAIILISVFAVRLGWFPTFGAGSGLADRLYHLFLPVDRAVADVHRPGRPGHALVDARRAEARARRGRAEPRNDEGDPSYGATCCATRSGPILTITGLLVAGLLVSSAVVESAFGLNGMGSLLVQSVDKQDFAIVQAIVLLVVFAFVLVNTVVDIAYPFIDPRVTAGSAAR